MSKKFINIRIPNKLILNYILFLKVTHGNSELLMNNYFTTMKEEIAIRIDSVKADLDKLSEQLSKLIDEKNRKMKVSLEKMNSKLKDQAQTSQKFINNLQSLMIKTEISVDKLEDNMYLCQDRIKELQSADIEFFKIFKQIKFKPNESELNITIIGELSDLEEQTSTNYSTSSNSTSHPDVKTNTNQKVNSNGSTLNSLQQQTSQLIESSESEVFEGSLDNDKYQALAAASSSKYEPNELKIIEMAKKVEWPCGIHSIGDKDLIMTDNVNNEIIILNSELQIVKQIKKVGDVSFSSPFGIASDDKDTVYVCDGGNHRVLVFNKAFSRVKKIIGKKGKLNGEFNFPLGICFYNGLLYVSDHDNRRVQVFTQNGDHTKEIRLLKNPLKKNMFVKDQDLINSPWCLGVVDNTIAVLDFCENIYIYNFEGQLRYVIQDTSINSICILDGYLYTHGNNGSFSCYEKSKKKYEQHQYELVYRHHYDSLEAYSAFMTNFNNNLAVTFGEKKFIALISKTSKRI